MAIPSSFLTGPCPGLFPFCKQLSIPYFLLLLSSILLLSLLLFRSVILRNFITMVSRSGSGQPMSDTVNGHPRALTMPEGPSKEFSGKLKVSQKPPTKKDLEKVADLPLLDRNGASRSFKSLHSDPEHRDIQTLVIFIRHFFCGVCLRCWNCRIARELTVLFRIARSTSALCVRQ